MEEKKVEEFLDSLGLDAFGYFDSEKDIYTIDLKDSDDYAYFYSVLNSSDLNLEEDSSMGATNVSSLNFIGDGYSLFLNANYEDDSYNLVIKDERDK